MPQKYIIIPKRLIICAWMWNAWRSNNLRLKLDKPSIIELFATFSHVCLTKLYILPFMYLTKLYICLIFYTICRKTKWITEKSNYQVQYIRMVHYVFFHRCVFSNVSSNLLPEKMHSHIGCTCLTFLHYAFSNVSSNCLPEKMHSHIGCIYLTFRHCAFSNVSPTALA